MIATFETPDGTREVEGSYLLACDGGRSTIRSQLGIPVEGESLDVADLLVDVKVDLDVQNPRDYPYLAYFADPTEWMILVRQPHCWRFLFPLGPGEPEPTREQFREKILRFIGPVTGHGDHQHHRLPHPSPHRDRVAARPRLPDGRRRASDHADVGARPQYRHSRRHQPAVAAGLGGARLGRSALLDGYAREQRPVARDGSGEMAEAARKYMLGQNDAVRAMSGGAWPMR